jgi:hypothetical protein
LSHMIDETGNRYGKLLVICHDGSRFEGRASRANWYCECDCGEYATVTGAHLREGSVVSCGCKRDASQYGKF